MFTKFLTLENYTKTDPLDFEISNESCCAVLIWSNFEGHFSSLLARGRPLPVCSVVSVTIFVILVLNE